MRSHLIWIMLLIAAPAFAQGAGQAPPDIVRVKVRATGQAPANLMNAREAAVEDALRRAVEAGAGVELASLTQTEDFRLVSDVIYTKTAGYVEKYDVLEENPDQQGLYTVRVEATVTRGTIIADIEAFKALLKRKGRPRLIVVGAADGRPFEARLTAEIEGTLAKRGFTVKELARLTENQRRDAERAARLELDPAKAALIVRELGADYLVIVSVEGIQHPPKTAYGQPLYDIDATGTLKVVRADTALLLASEVVKRSLTRSSAPKALEDATTEVTQEGLKLAIPQMAKAWLDDVDVRGGQQVEVVFNRLAGARLAPLVAKLRGIKEVRDVIIDSTDAEGRSQLRVITNSSAADVGLALRQADGGLVMKESTKYRVVFDAGAATPPPPGGEIRIVIVVAIGLGAVAIGGAVVVVLRRRPRAFAPLGR